MSDIATCAKCGDMRELCQSVRIDGMKQPRICKECLVGSMTTGDYSTNDLYWVAQMGQLDDHESIAILRAQLGIPS